MSIITDEVLANMARARIKARKEFAVHLSQTSVDSLKSTSASLGVNFGDYEGDLLALIEVLVEETYPQLIRQPVDRDEYETDRPVVDEVSQWFSSGEAPGQVASHLTSDVIKLDPQPMTAQYADMGAPPAPTPYDRMEINQRIAAIHYNLNRGDTASALAQVIDFASHSQFSLMDYVAFDNPINSPVPTTPTWAVVDRLYRALEGVIDGQALGVLAKFIQAPYDFDGSSHQNSIGAPEVREALVGVLNYDTVARCIRDYMTGHWSSGTIDSVIQAALGPAVAGITPEPVSSWPQAGPISEATQITPIIEPRETDPATESPTHYGPMD